MRYMRTSNASRRSRMASSRSSETDRCGPDCQRRVSWDGRPPSPRTLTANPSRCVSISPWPVRLIGDHSPKGGSNMKYLLLIHQGTTPTPRDPEAWATLSQDDQNAVFADYKAINETPGVTPGVAMDSPETATTVRVQDGRTLTTDGPFAELKEAIGGYLV